jgi:hypothetical protein
VKSPVLDAMQQSGPATEGVRQPIVNRDTTPSNKAQYQLKLEPESLEIQVEGEGRAISKDLTKVGNK